MPRVQEGSETSNFELGGAEGMLLREPTRNVGKDQ